MSWFCPNGAERKHETWPLTLIETEHSQINAAVFGALVKHIQQWRFTLVIVINANKTWNDFANILWAKFMKFEVWKQIQALKRMSLDKQWKVREK